MIFLKNKKPYEKIIKDNAKKYNLKSEIVAQVILQESGGNPYAFRYEPAFFDKYLENKLPYTLGGEFNAEISINSEIRFRAFSFGLMQIMGQTAREMGFQGYLPELYEAEKNIDLGCKILRRNLDEFNNDYKLALSAYNSGIGYIKKYGETQYTSEVFKKDYSKLI